MITAHEIVQAYLDALLANPDCATAFQDSAVWTKLATTALVKAGREGFRIAEHTAKEHPDRYGRSEYLTLDVVLCDPSTWGPPLFVAEHESWSTRTKVQYDAWKLYAVEARRRVLIAYWGLDKTLRTFDDLKTAVAEVSRDNAERDLLVIAADGRAVPKTATELRALHQSAVIGRWLS